MNDKLHIDRDGQTVIRPNKICACLSTLLLSLAAMATHASSFAPAQEVESTPEQDFQMALEAQTARDYRTMLMLLRQAAEASNMQAQEMLGMTLLAGSTLYGSAVRPDHCEAGKWMRRAAAQGSEIGKHQLTFLNRLRQAPFGQDVCSTAGK